MQRQIYVVLSHTSTNLARLIRLATHYQYNHVSIALDESLENMYSFGRFHPRNPFFAGFVREDRVNGFYSVFRDTTSRIYRLCISQEQYDQLSKLIESFASCDRKYRFNLIGLFLNRFRIPYSRENHYFCAQFVSYVLEHAQIYKFNKNHKLVNIKDFEAISGAEVIYEGLLTDYVA